MGKVITHLVLCCLVVSLSWGSVVKREQDDTEADDVQTPVAGGSGAATSSISYGIVCDAGSTSTRLKIYQVNGTEEYLGLPQINLIYTKKFLPSLDAFVNNKRGLKDYVTQILDEAKKIIPQSQLSETTAHLMATAGLRFLKPRISGQLIKDIIEVFDKFHINHFRGREGIAILSGEEEGAYSWVAANYLLGNFDQNRPDCETVGLLEMGGGSTQIAFVPKDPIYSGEFQININGRQYDLYAHSYLQFGITAVQFWVAKILSQLYPDSLVLGNPCMLKGDVKEMEVDNGRTLLLHGTSDPKGCKRIFKHILAPEKGLKCQPKPCAIGNVYQPSVDDIQFYAIQGFTLAPVALNVLGPDQILDINLLEQAAFQYCQRNLTEALQAGIDESVASTNCLMGIYTATLFTLSYDFPRNTTNIQVTDTIKGEMIEWSLGVMVLEVSHNSMTRRRR